MPPDVLDHPQPQVQSAPVTQSQDLRGLLDATAKAPTEDDVFKAEPQTPEKAIEQPKTEPKLQEKSKKPQIAQKQAETSPKSDKPKGKWQGLEALKSLENAKEDGSEEGATQEGAETTETEAKTSQDDVPLTRWKELRATEDKFKELEPLVQKLQRENEELKSKPQIPEEAQRRMDMLEQMYAVELLDQKPEFQAEVLAPMQEQLNSLASVAEHAGLDANQKQALRAAADNPDSFTRIRSIKQIIGASTKIEDPEDLGTLVQFALSASDKYQDAVKRQHTYVRDASQVAQSTRGKEAQFSQQEKARKEQEYSTAHKEMIGTLKPPMQPLFDDPEFGPLLTEALESIRPGETPMDQAYQAQAGEVLPFAVKYINKLIGERDSARKALKAREAAKPRTTDGTTPVAEQGAQQPDLKQLLNGMQR